MDDFRVTRYDDDLTVVLDAAIAINGEDGEDGEDGAGVPPLGLTAQILAKKSEVDFDTEWVDPSLGVPVDGTAGQVLTKLSALPLDTAWVAPEEYSPIGHTHPILDITDLQAALDAKVDDTDLTGYAKLAVANTFTLGQTINMGDTLPSTCLTLTSTWGSASAGPFLQLSRLSPDPAALDEIGQISFIGKDSGLVDTVYASIGVVIVDPANSSEDSRLRIRTLVSAVTTTIATFEAGVLIGASTGGDKGVGTLNATTLYEAGVALASKYAQLTVANTFTAHNTFNRVTVTGGPLTVDRTTFASAADVVVATDALQSAYVNFYTGALNRWRIGRGSTAEGGSGTTSTGSDFNLQAYDNAGTSLGNVFHVLRGLRTLVFDAPFNLATVTAPASPNNGDVWFDGTALKIRISGATKTVTVT